MRKRIWAFLVSICLVNLLIFSTAAAAEHPDIQKGIPMSRKEISVVHYPDSESGDLEMVTTVKLKKIKNNTKIYLNETKELQLVFYHKASKIEQSLVIDVK